MKKSSAPAAAPKQKTKESNESQPRGQRVTGFMLTGLGIFFLFQTLTGFAYMGKLWPLLLIIVGAAALLGRYR